MRWPQDIKSVMHRFDSKWTPEPNTGCWLWHGPFDGKGYGQFGTGRRRWAAHRFAYEKLAGVIPAGLVIDHLCKVTCCVNPQHLEPVTQRENIYRGDSVKVMKQQAAMRTHCSRGHDLAMTSRTIKSGLRVCQECSRVRNILWRAAKRRKQNASADA